jgi:hypothetical protein
MSVFTLDWRGHGTQTWFTPFAAGVINRHSAVFATICEVPIYLPGAAGRRRGLLDSRVAGPARCGHVG